MGVVLVIMRILFILFKSLLLSHCQPPSPYRNTDMEISCESAVCESDHTGCLYIIASDVPGGNRILIIKIKAQHSALSKAIKNTEFK